MFENKHDEAISYAQSTRSKNGEDWEGDVFQYGKPYGLIDAKHITVYCLETGKLWELDGLLNDKILVEMCTSVKDAKEAKIIGESRAFKRKYPNHKFVVFINFISIPRKSDGLDSHYDHLIRCSTIDNVLLGWEEVTKFIKNPFWDKKQKISQVSNNTKLNNRLQIGKENQMTIQDKMIQALMNKSPQYVGQVLNSMNHTSNDIEPNETNKDSMKFKKKTYFENNITEVEHNHDDFVSLKGLGFTSLSKFKQSRLSSEIMKSGEPMLKKNGVSLGYNMYGFPKSWKSRV